jgi:hypothetical protein
MAVEMAADEWIAQHGRFALPLARIRAIDAYLLGDLTEQEYWSRIREMIEDDEESLKDREMAARAIVKPTKSTCD